MKNIIAFLIFILTGLSMKAQVTEDYKKYVRQGDSLSKLKLYSQAAHAYSTAFTANNGNAMPDDRYSAACAWAQAGNKDSAFYQLTLLADKGAYTNYNHLVIDEDFKGLYNDPRWTAIKTMVKSNKEKGEVNFIKPAVDILDSVYQDDQRVRQGIMELIEKYGGSSPEARERSRLMGISDSTNLIRISRILDKWGWLGADKVGAQGNMTIFLIIQHSRYEVQKKYLPLMRTAVSNKQASASHLAYLEDRVALHEGRKQIYGTQYAPDPATGKVVIRTMEDPDNVDQRRAAIGLGKLNDYLKQLGTTWDLEAYKTPEAEKVRKEIEAKMSKKN
jgi:hypothetical protein